MSKYKDGQIIGYDLRGDGAHPIKVQFFTEDGTYGSIVCEMYGWEECFSPDGVDVIESVDEWLDYANECWWFDPA